jgi:hypothetical protein
MKSYKLFEKDQHHGLITGILQIHDDLGTLSTMKKLKELLKCYISVTDHQHALLAVEHYTNTATIPLT